jgi:hypothetical protein
LNPGERERERERESGEECRTHREDKKGTRFWWDNQKPRDLGKDQGARS